jgi:hypothetical protein
LTGFVGSNGTALGSVVVVVVGGSVVGAGAAVRAPLEPHAAVAIVNSTTTTTAAATFFEIFNALIPTAVYRPGLGVTVCPRGCHEPRGPNCGCKTIS